jgi:hypothetical protein
MIESPIRSLAWYRPGQVFGLQLVKKSFPIDLTVPT